MDGQDEENRRIYNQGDFTKNRRTIRKTPRSSIGGVLGEEKKKSFSVEDRGRALNFPLATLLTIQLPNDPAQLLKASSQRPSSQARFSIKFIILGLLGLGLLTSTVKEAPQNGTLQLAPSVGRTYVLMRTIIEQGRAKFPRGNDDGQPTGPQMENCQEVHSSTGVWRHVRGPRPHQGSDDPPTSRAVPVGPQWRKTAVARNAFKGLCGGNSSWRSVLVPSSSLK